MDPLDFYVEFIPCNNGYNVCQYEWLPEPRAWNVTQRLTFEDIDEAIIALRGMVENPISYLRKYN